MLPPRGIKLAQSKKVCNIKQPKSLPQTNGNASSKSGNLGNISNSCNNASGGNDKSEETAIGNRDFHHSSPSSSNKTSRRGRDSVEHTAEHTPKVMRKDYHAGGGSAGGGGGGRGGASSSKELVAKQQAKYSTDETKSPRNSPRQPVSTQISISSLASTSSFGSISSSSSSFQTARRGTVVNRIFKTS